MLGVGTPPEPELIDGAADWAIAREIRSKW